ncbi:MAG: hypothetical protein U0L33_03680 [Acutalibacteraceae bacterium]|nr:hypothetical protein [Acutalibacteraceae bacterium]
MELNIENLMKTAVEEMKNGQHSEAAKHFDMVVINDASNIDAPFFRAYCNCYDIKLGEMSNAAIGFTNAFCRYVDAVKALNDPALEKEKLDFAVTLLTELVSMYKLNAKNQMFTTPSIGITISTAATNMNNNCRNKLVNSNANISEEVLTANEANNQANNKTGLILAALVAVGAIIFILWMIPWYMF